MLIFMYVIEILEDNMGYILIVLDISVACAIRQWLRLS